MDKVTKLEMFGHDYLLSAGISNLRDYAVIENDGSATAYSLDRHGAGWRVGVVGVLKVVEGSIIAERPPKGELFINMGGMFGLANWPLVAAHLDSGKVFLVDRDGNLYGEDLSSRISSGELQ